MRTYVIVNTSDLTSLDYNELLTTSIETTILNVEGDKAIVKYEGNMPDTINALNDKTLHNHNEILVIVKSDEWKPEPAED